MAAMSDYEVEHLECKDLVLRHKPCGGQIVLNEPDQPATVAQIITAMSTHHRTFCPVEIAKER